MSSRVTKKLPDSSSQHEQPIQEFSFETMPKEEFRPPSPTPSFTEAELLSSVIKRLGELEEKVDTLQAKPSEMPYEKEELLNAAVYRVDALEAELIATKKVAYIFTLFLWGFYDNGCLAEKFMKYQMTLHKYGEYLCLNISFHVTTWNLCFEQALYEALMKQEELLAYIDSQEDAKYRVSEVGRCIVLY